MAGVDPEDLFAAVEVRPVDVNRSESDCTLEERHRGTEAQRHEGAEDGLAVRLGMRMVKGLRENDARALFSILSR